jgi:hypothetical protein
MQQDVQQQQRSATPARRATRLQVLSTPRGGTAATEQQQTKRAVVVAVDGSEVRHVRPCATFPPPAAAAAACSGAAVVCWHPTTPPPTAQPPPPNSAAAVRWLPTYGVCPLLRPGAAPACSPPAPHLCRTAWWPSTT